MPSNRTRTGHEVPSNGQRTPNEPTLRSRGPDFGCVLKDRLSISPQSPGRACTAIPLYRGPKRNCNRSAAVGLYGPPRDARGNFSGHEERSCSPISGISLRTTRSSCPDGIRAFQSSSLFPPDDHVIGPAPHQVLWNAGPTFHAITSISLYATRWRSRGSLLVNRFQVHQRLKGDVVKGFVTPQLSRFPLRHQLAFIVVGTHVTQV